MDYQQIIPICRLCALLETKHAIVSRLTPIFNDLAREEHRRTGEKGSEPPASCPPLDSTVFLAVKHPSDTWVLRKHIVHQSESLNERTMLIGIVEVHRSSELLQRLSARGAAA